MERLTVKTGVYQNGKLEIIVGMKCGVEFKDIFDRLAAIEDILGTSTTFPASVNWPKPTGRGGAWYKSLCPEAMCG